MSPPADAEPDRRQALDDADEIADLVRRFYRDVAQDDVLGPVFNDVARVDWPAHLTKLTAFWSRALLGVSGYDGNPFAAHQRIHRQRPFTKAHFDRWLALFEDTLDQGWSGPEVERARDLARTVARVHLRQLDAGAPGVPVATPTTRGGADRGH